MKVLEVNNLSLGFKTEQGFCRALHGVNFSLEEGKMLALVGESGCGKTVSAMSILKLLPKNAQIIEGQILFKKQDLLALSEKEMHKIRGARIALIPQDPMTSLNPLYTIGNQLVESIRAHTKVTERQALRKAKEVMDLVRIPDINKKLNFYPHEFSGGMKQRIIIAMALACSAELIIADEPTTALDVTIQKQIMDLIDEIKKEFRTTVLLISHDLALVSNYADYVSVMYAGHIVEQAPAKDFFRHTLHPYSAALLNSLPTKNPALKLKIIEGAPPGIQEQIAGCKFHPRCEFFKPGLCDANEPVLTEKEIYHYSACLVK